MTDSSDTRITYRAIQERAASDAREWLDEIAPWPKKNTCEAWEEYIDALESVDPFELTSETQWDWTIYYHRALELCQAVPSDVLHQAESEWHDMCGPEGIDESFGLYELAAILAAIIVEREIVDAVEQVREELLELANNQLENLS